MAAIMGSLAMLGCAPLKRSALTASDDSAALLVIDEAEAPDPSDEVARWDKLVGLSPEQKSKALEFFARRREDYRVAASDPMFIRELREMEANSIAEEAVLELLSPIQKQAREQKIASSFASELIDHRIAELDGIVGLSDEQRAAIKDALVNSAKDKGVAGPDGTSEEERYQAIEALIEGILTPEQRTRRQDNRSDVQRAAEKQEEALKSVLRSDPALSTDLGPLTTIEESPNTFEISYGEGYGANQGIAVGLVHYTVSGAKGSKELKLYWKKVSESAPPTALRICDKEGKIYVDTPREATAR